MSKDNDDKPNLWICERKISSVGYYYFKAVKPYIETLPVRTSQAVDQAAKDCNAKRREQKLAEALRYYANGEYIADQTYVGDEPRDFCKYQSQKVAQEALENYRKQGGE